MWSNQGLCQENTEYEKNPVINIPQLKEVM